MSISIDQLKELAHNLYFDMDEQQYETLQKEFEIILKQMELIGEIENIDNVEPLVFPCISVNCGLREDEEGEVLSTQEVLQNAADKMMDMVKVQKVVG